MIKINLATRKQAMLSTESGPSKSGLGKLGLRMDDLSDLPLRRIGLSILVAAMAWYLLEGYKKEELDRLEVLINKTNSERNTLQAELAKIKGYEELKKTLDANEMVIRTKMSTIQKLIEDRTTPPKLLLELSKSIPAEVWLSELRMQDNAMTLKGAALGFNQISDFMKNLNESIYFKDLSLKSTQQIKDEAGVDVAAFELSAQRRRE